MKTLTLILHFTLTGFLVNAQDADFSAMVKTLDSTIETLYAVISGDKGEKRDWELFNYLFIPEARLIPSGKNQEGKTSYSIMSPQDYVERAGSYLEENGFFEKEISRETDRFGNIVQLFSTYESYRSSTDTEPFARGINSIQLMFDGNRWWILNIYWQPETAEFPIPEEYLD